MYVGAMQSEKPLESQPGGSAGGGAGGEGEKGGSAGGRGNEGGEGSAGGAIDSQANDLASEQLLSFQRPVETYISTQSSSPC